MKSRRLLLFLVLIGTTAWAQQRAITSDMPVETATLHQWLNSGDPRLIAWAADFTRRNHDAALIAEMPAWLESWTMPPQSSGDGPQADSSRAVQAVLDTLIQENAVVPLKAIDAVTVFYPAQAAILVSRQPLSESRMTLDEWTAGRSSTWGGPILARIATMMLAKDPGDSEGYDPESFEPRGLVANVVAASEVDVWIRVSKDGEPPEQVSPAVCGDNIGYKPLVGWPMVYGYELEENSNGTGPLVVDLAGDRILTSRHDESGGWGTCHYVQPLNRFTRHRLLAYWLGVPDDQMAWRTDEFVGIVYTSKAAYERQLARVIDSERRKLQATVEALRVRGLLSNGWTDDVIPKLVVTVQCDIKPCPLQ